MTSQVMDAAQELQGVVAGAFEPLAALSDAQASAPLAPGKWSPKQLVGHLIDSASNNHQRFVRARLGDELVFPGYAQDEWVAAQGYDEAPWLELLELWKAYNLHLARVIASVPPEVATRPRTDHNLHEIAWESPLADEPVTLAFFMGDYVNHLRHHLRQIDPSLADAPLPQLAHGRHKSR